MSARSSLNFPNNFTQVPINTSAGGPVSFITGVPGQRIKVFRMKLLVGAATTISFFDGATLLDDLVFPGVAAMVLDFTSMDMPPWYQTSPGNSFVIQNSGFAQLSGNMDYLISGGA